MTSTADTDRSRRSLKNTRQGKVLKARQSFNS